MALWIITLLVIVATWVAGHFFAVATGIKLVVTAGTLLCAAAVLLFARLRAKLAARAIERELMKQAEREVASARPDRRQEIYQLQEQFKKGLAALKSSKLGAASGASALYALPWYIIVGPPGAGKTTALKHSGLAFPFEGGTGGPALKGIGGTRSCDWWFTNEAILLDTAGRYATHEDDRDEWLAFLDMLRRYRPQKPLNGVLVAVSVADVVNATSEQLDAMAKTLRARIDEVMTRLEMVVPVYVVFTKADLVAGFIESFEDLKKSERGQVWGMTFPLAAPPDDPARAFDAEFDALVRALDGHALRRVGGARSAEARAKVLQLPLEVRELKASLAEFLGVLLGNNVFQRTPIFRGVYFTSGTQEGRPFERVMANMARAFGIRQPSAEGAPPAVDAKSYFLTDLFAKIVFPDQHVAGRSSAAARRQVVRRVALAAGAALLSGLIAVPALVSCANNKDLLRASGEGSARAAAKDLSEPGAMGEKLAALDALRTRVDEMGGWKRDGAPLAYGFGLYVGPKLLPPLAAEHDALVARALDRTAKAALDRQLRAAPETANRSASDFSRRYEELKTYLMLTEVEHLDVAWVTPRVGRLWADAAHATPDDLRVIETNVAFHLERVKRGEAPPLARDAALVSFVRSALLRVPQIGSLYEALVRDTNDEVAPIRFESIFYGSVRPFVRAKRGVIVEGAYTRLGWAKMKRLLDAERATLLTEGWVLDREELPQPAETAREVQTLRRIYFERFRDEWRAFLMDIEVSRPENAERAHEELLALSEPEWPYMRLLRVLDENVTLDADDPAPSPTAALLEKAKDLAKDTLLGQPVEAGALLQRPERVVSPVEQAFRALTAFAIAPPGTKADTGAAAAPTALSQYQAVVHKLIGVLSELRDGAMPPDPKVLASEFELALRTTTTLLAELDGGTRPLLAPLLLNPIGLAWASVLNDVGGAAGGLWEATVWKAWSARLDALYPFNEAAPADAKIEDFTEFFRPTDGTLWAFFEQSLKGSLEQRGAGFVPVRRMKSSVGYTSPFLSCLARAKKISDTMFGAGSKELESAFDMRLHSVSSDIAEVTIEIDGVSHAYGNTPEEWFRARWPAKDAKARGAKIRVRGFAGLSEEIVRSGDFGFFRLLAAADVRPAQEGGPVLVATWRLSSERGSTVKLDVRPSRADNPLVSRLFSGMRCPRLITANDG